MNLNKFQISTALKTLFNRDSSCLNLSLNFIFNIFHSPPTEAPIKSFLFHKIPDFSQYSPTQSQLSRKTSEAKPLIDDDFSMNHSRHRSEEEDIGLRLAPMYKYSTRFDGLAVDGETVYTITISTELDGKTITQICQQTEKPPGSSGKDGSASPKPPKDTKPASSDSKPSKKKWGNLFVGKNRIRSYKSRTFRQMWRKIYYTVSSSNQLWNTSFLSYFKREEIVSFKVKHLIF